jgi:hypothetical protein
MGQGSRNWTREGTITVPWVRRIGPRGAEEPGQGEQPGGTGTGPGEVVRRDWARGNRDWPGGAGIWSGSTVYLGQEEGNGPGAGLLWVFR